MRRWCLRMPISSASSTRPGMCRASSTYRRVNARRRPDMSAQAESAPLVRVLDIHKSFGTAEVLCGISFAVGKGQAVCIIGPSGSGKSTILRCINGLVSLDRGEIFVGPHAVHRLRRDTEMVALRKDVSIVFQ